MCKGGSTPARSGNDRGDVPRRDVIRRRSMLGACAPRCQCRGPAASARRQGATILFTSINARAHTVQRWPGMEGVQHVFRLLLTSVRLSMQPARILHSGTHARRRAGEPRAWPSSFSPSTRPRILDVRSRAIRHSKSRLSRWALARSVHHSAVGHTPPERGMSK